jgi:hypothetical protein
LIAMSEFQINHQEIQENSSIPLFRYIRQLTACFRSLPKTFATEAEHDLEAIRRCNSD